MIYNSDILLMLYYYTTVDIYPKSIICYNHHGVSYDTKQIFSYKRYNNIRYSYVFEIDIVKSFYSLTKRKLQTHSNAETTNGCEDFVS